MSDLVKRLRWLAERDTVMSEFASDEHIAGIAADRIEELEAKLEELKSDIAVTDAQADVLMHQNEGHKKALSDALSELKALKGQRSE